MVNNANIAEQLLTFSRNLIMFKPFKYFPNLFVFFMILTFHAFAEVKDSPVLNGVNFVKVSDRIDTSGQPPKELLERFAIKKYDLVINLAPPLSKGSVLEEGGLIAQSGTKYVNIPVDWKNPTQQDFNFFSSVLSAKGSKKVLVHCQINMRGSLFTFLYRVIHEKIDPALAQEKMTLVWTPTGNWKNFAQILLNKHQIDYELL